MADPLTLKDYYTETRIVRARVLWLLIIFMVMAIILISRYYHLQIRLHSDFLTRAEANRIHTQHVPPTRGLIMDRTGRLLADNTPSFSLNIVKERVGNLDETLDELKSLIELADKDIEKYRKRLKQSHRRPYDPTPLKFRLSDEEIAIIAVNEYRLPGVEVHAELIRHYPMKSLFAHGVGYVGSINDRELQSLGKEGLLEKYQGIYTIGKTGIEKFYETTLLGESGAQSVETNARGRVLRVLDEDPPTPGVDLTLHVDSRLQKIAHEAMKGMRGSVVALDTLTGGVLAVASVPSFDPNLFVTGISVKNYNRLRDSWKLPLFNRVLQGQYPPGSTIKPVIGLAGLEQHVITREWSIEDLGFYQIPDEERNFRDWKKGGHGSRVNLKKALAESCDTYFYDLSYRLGIDRISPMLAEFGLGKTTKVDQTSEYRGLLPSREWKKNNRGMHWFPGDTLNIGIGQGDMLTTPMQLAYMTSVIANRGKRLQPQLIHKIGDKVIPPKTLPPLYLSNEKNWDYIIEGMTEVVHGIRGTAKKMGAGLTYTMAGKTGTAQVVGIKQDEEYDAQLISLRNRDHALFIGFAPANDPQIAVAVVVENGEHGSTTAAPIARAIMDAYLLKNEEPPTTMDTMTPIVAEAIQHGE